MCSPLSYGNKDFVGSIRLADIIGDKLRSHTGPTKQIVAAGSKQSLTEAIEMLKSNKYRCLPVYDQTHHDEEDDDDDKQNRNYLGIVTIMDILCFMAFKNSETDHAESFELCKLLGLAKDSTETAGPVWVYPSYHHFEVLLEPFWKGTQTVLVRHVTDDGEEVTVLSQTDVLRYLYHNSDKLDQELLYQTVEDAGMLRNQFYHRSITIKASKSAQVAFQQMYYYHRDGLAVIEEEDGRVIANISASDLRGITPAEFHELDSITVLDFLKHHSPTGKVRPVVAATAKTTVKEAMAMIIDQGIHRLWVVCDDGQIVTKIDIDDLIYGFVLFDHHTLNFLSIANKD